MDVLLQYVDTSVLTGTHDSDLGGVIGFIEIYWIYRHILDL